MKRFTAILTAFLTFLLISINSLPVFASLPPDIPKFYYSQPNIAGDSTKAVIGHILFYNQSLNSWRSFSVITEYSYRNVDYFNLTYDAENDLYFFGSQDHLSSNTLFYYNPINKTNTSNGVYYVELPYYYSNNWCTWTNTTITTWNSNNLLNNSVDTPTNSKGMWEIAFSTCNVKVDNEIIFNGSTSAFYENLITIGNTPSLPYPQQDTPVEPPTEAPTIGEGGDSGDDVETSKNILDNVKQILTNIANLPKNIANAIHNFFSDLLSGIITGLNNLKDGIIQGLKDLFIPSDNAFTDIQNIINEKFGFISQIKDMFSSIINATFNVSDEPPTFNITIYGQDLSIIDWSIYSPYRLIVHGIIIAISYINFIMRLIKRIPKIIGGIS